MPSKGMDRIRILQGTPDLIVLRTLASMGPQHAYGIATRLQQGWFAGAWGTPESHREARFYAITKAGQKALGRETERWRQVSGLVEKLLGEEL